MSDTTTLTEQLEEHLSQLSFEDMSGGFNEYETKWLLERDDETQRHLLTLSFDQIREYVDGNMVYALLITSQPHIQPYGVIAQRYVSIHRDFASVESEAIRVVEELGLVQCPGQYSTIAEIEYAEEYDPNFTCDKFTMLYFPIAADGKSVRF